jgi:DNA-binding transcriptional LysR family regulator
MLPSERLKGIEAFVAAADLASFTAAGQRLNLTTSAISKSVGRLEVRLGCRLFERTTRRLALTSEGAAFHATCVRVLADLAEAEAVLAAHGSEPVGRIKVDVPIAFGRIRVMPLLLRLAERHPALHPHVTFTDRYVDILEDGVDVAVRIGQAQGGTNGLGQRYLGTEHRIFCAAPSYLERRGVPQNRDELLEADRILYGRSDGTVSAWRLGKQDAAEDRAQSGRIVLGSAEAQVEAVKAGFGIAQLATWLIHDELTRGELVGVLPQFATAGLPLHLVWPKNRQLSPKVDALLTLLGNELRVD